MAVERIYFEPPLKIATQDSEDIEDRIFSGTFVAPGRRRVLPVGTHFVNPPLAEARGLRRDVKLKVRKEGDASLTFNSSLESDNQQVEPVTLEIPGDSVFVLFKDDKADGTTVIHGALIFHPLESPSE